MMRPIGKNKHISYIYIDSYARIIEKEIILNVYFYNIRLIGI